MSSAGAQALFLGFRGQSGGRSPESLVELRCVLTRRLLGLLAVKRKFICSYIFLVLSALLFRLDAASLLGWKTSMGEGLVLGVYYDLLISTIPFLLSSLLGIFFPFLGRGLLLIFLGLFFISAFASTLYYRFFGNKLYWWIVGSHAGDTASIWDSILALAREPWVLGGVLFGILSIVVVAISKSSSGHKYRFHRAFWALGSLLALGLVIHLQQWPQNHRRFTREVLGLELDPIELRSVATDHFLIRWMPELTRARGFGEYSGTDLRRLSREERSFPAALIRSFAEGAWELENEWTQVANPLKRKFHVDRVQQNAWKSRLGFESSDRLNVALIFVESLRAYEFFHPIFREKLFPELTKRLEKHALIFRRVYSPAVGPGATVRGMFATLCSHFPNLIGPTPYLANPRVRVTCIQELLAQEGYHTEMMVAGDPAYHNKATFERAHGTAVTRGWNDFDPKKEDPRTPLGVHDRAYYPKFLARIVELSTEARPFFLHGINIGTHVPWSWAKRDLPSDLAELSGGQWQDYLRSLHQLDQDLSKFVDDFLESPASDNTFLLFAADHSVNVRADPALTDTDETYERLLRIPLWFLAKDLRSAEIRDEVIHQFDLAPTLATVLLKAETSFEASFLGQSLDLRHLRSSTHRIFQAMPSPSSYGVDDLQCYCRPNNLRCYDHQRGDPLFDSAASIVPSPIDAESRCLFAEKISEANFLSLGHNKVLVE